MRMPPSEYLRSNYKGLRRVPFYSKANSNLLLTLQQSERRNKKDGFGVLAFEGGSADLRLDWQVRIALDHVQMGGPSRFFPVGTPARRVRKLLLI